MMNAKDILHCFLLVVIDFRVSIVRKRKACQCDGFC